MTVRGLRGALWAAPLMLLLAGGCNKSPVDRTEDASGGGPLGRFGVTPNLVVFSDELKTGGSAFTYPGGDNQVLVFNDQSNPISHRSIRYSWNGQPPKAGDSSFIFAGFDLCHVVDNTTNLTVYANSPGRDLRQANYSKVTFYARGSLASLMVLKVEVADDGDTNTPAPCLVLSANGTDDADPGTSCSKAVLRSSWQSYTITLSNSDLRSVKDFFKATLIFNNPLGNLRPGQGGTAYFDQIQYAP